MTISKQLDMCRMANDIHDIVYGLGTDIDKRGEILAWLASSDLAHKNIFTLALEWKRMENRHEVTE